MCFDDLVVMCLVIVLASVEGQGNYVDNVLERKGSYKRLLSRKLSLGLCWQADGMEWIELVTTGLS